MYAMGTSGDASLATPLLTEAVLTNANGEFSFGLYTCPSPSANIYLVATGGNPGLAAGTNNMAISEIATMGPCGQLTSSTFVSINEATTIGAVWPLASLMKSATQIGSGTADLPQLSAAIQMVDELVDTTHGKAPGPALAVGSTAPTSKLYTLASIIANCVDSAGGTAGDGSICGRLFAFATVPGQAAPTDTVGAALAIARNPTQNSSALFDLFSPVAPFQPVLSTPPADWTLTVETAIPSPVSSLASGTYSSAQQLVLSDAASVDAIYYTTDGTVPAAGGTQYTGPLTIGTSQVVRAIATVGGQTSPVTNVTVVFAPQIAVSVTPGSLTLTPSDAATFTATVTGAQNTDVIWSLSLALGSISAGGVYTAPASISAPATVTVTASSQQDPGKTATATIAIQPATVHYLSATGDDSNDGLTPQTAWWSPNHPNLTCGVDTIIAEPSSAYGARGFVEFYADWGKVNCPGGNKVVWLKCAKAFACKDINMPLAFTVNESYWGVSGFEVDSSQNPGFAAVNMGNETIHHIIFANNICNDCAGAGFLTFNHGNYGVDYINIIGNIAYNSANATGECGSGISIAAPAQSDTASGTHIYVAGNFSIANMDPAQCAGTAATDGNGLILDTFSALSYTMQTVAANNVLVGNGGRGLEVLNGQAPTYTYNNTLWGNNTDSNQSTTWAGEYLVALANHVASSFDLASTNTATAYGGNPLSAFYLVGTDSTTSLSSDWARAVSKINIGPGSNAVLTNNVLGVDPVFTSPSIPAEPVCDAYSTTVACMATVIQNFTPKNSAAKVYGYQLPSTTSSHDPLFPQWLCNANLPSGLVTLGCS